MSIQCIKIVLFLHINVQVLSAPQEPPQGNFKGYPVPRRTNTPTMQDPQIGAPTPPNTEQQSNLQPREADIIFTDNRVPAENTQESVYPEQGIQPQVAEQQNTINTPSISLSVNQMETQDQNGGSDQSIASTTLSSNRRPVNRDRNSHVFNFEPTQGPNKDTVSRSRSSHVFNFRTTGYTPQYQPPKITTERSSPRFYWAPSNTGHKQDENRKYNNFCNEKHTKDDEIVQSKNEHQAAKDSCQWTPWQNTDRPTGRCDCESLPPNCLGGKVEEYKIKTSNGQIFDSVEASMRMNNQVLSFTQDQGVACWNKDQADSHCQDYMFLDQFQGGPPCCEDYSVQYCCAEQGLQSPKMEMVSVKISINLESLEQKVILYPKLKMLLILVPAHGKWEGVTVMMDQQQKQQVVKSENRCMFTALPEESQDIFKTFQLFKGMSDKHHNMSSGGDQNIEPKSYALHEEREILGHKLDSENSVIQDSCRGNKLYRVTDRTLSEDELKKLDAGKMVPVKAPVTKTRQQDTGGCTSSVTVMTRVTGTHCWYTYRYPDPITGLSLTFQHLGMATKSVDCCIFGSAPLPTSGPHCWCGQINANTLAQCGAADIPTYSQCGSTSSNARSHIENWSPDLMAWAKTPQLCSFNIQKMAPGQTCTLVIDIEVLHLGREKECQSGAGQVIVSIGQTKETICGIAAQEEAGVVKLTSGQENPLVMTWPAGTNMATVMILSGAQQDIGQKWAFKVLQNC